MARPHRVRRRRRYRRGRTAMDDRAAEGRHHTLPVIRLRIVVADYLGAAVRPRLATKRLIRQVLTVYTGDCPLWTARTGGQRRRCHIAVGEAVRRRASTAMSSMRGRLPMRWCITVWQTMAGSSARTAVRSVRRPSSMSWSRSSTNPSV